MAHLRRGVQRWAEVGAPGLVNFFTAVAYHICPSLPAPFTQPGASTLTDLCTSIAIMRESTQMDHLTEDCIVCLKV